MSRSVLVAMLLVSMFGGACSTSSPIDVKARKRDCEVSDLSQVLGNPSGFNGKRFCGNAYYGGNVRTMAFFGAPLGSKDDEYDRALLLLEVPKRTVTRLRNLAPGAEIYVAGILDASHCNGSDGTAQPEECVPISHPVYIVHPLVEF